MGISGKLWFVGNGRLEKLRKKNVILATTHMVLYPAPAVIHGAGSTSGNLDLVWLEALWKCYRGYKAAISGKLWLSGKNELKHWCMDKT